MSSNDIDVDREEFYRRIHEMYNRKHSNTFLLSPTRYLQLIEEVKRAKNAIKKTPEDYRRLKRYDVVQTPDGDRLYLMEKPGQKIQQMFVNTEEMYNIVRDSHLRLNHGGRSRMMVELKKKYRNVTAEIVLVYLAMCKSCKNKTGKRIRPKIKKNDDTMDFTDEDPLQNDSNSTSNHETVRSNIMTFAKQDISDTWSHPELYSRGQVDILNVTNDSNEEFNYMMVYREYISKFIHLKPLKAVSVHEVTHALLDIFLVFGAPNILQSKNGTSIITKICRKISVLCPDLKVVVGEGEFSKDAYKGKSNEDILRKLNDWLSQSHSTYWQQGLKYVQYSLNSMFNEILCKTPNEMIFVKNPRKGLASLMAKAIYDDLVTENDFREILEENEEQECFVPKQLKIEESLVLPTEFIKKEMETDCIEKHLVNRALKTGPWGSSARQGRSARTLDPALMRRALLDAHAGYSEARSQNGNRTGRATTLPGLSSTTNSCGGSRLCRTRYNTTAPMYGVSLTSGQPVTIVQKFPDLLQQVVFEVCESSECSVVRGSCTQTYVPYLFLVLPLGPVTLTGQDYVLVESGCVCRPDPVP